MTTQRTGIGTRIDPDDRRLIEDVIDLNPDASAGEIYRMCRTRSARFAASKRSVERLMAARLKDLSGPWSIGLAGSIEEARLVAPVLAALITRHPTWRLTRAQAGYVARIRAANPDFDEVRTYLYASRYYQRGGDDPIADRAIVLNEKQWQTREDQVSDLEHKYDRFRRPSNEQ